MEITSSQLAEVIGLHKANVANIHREMQVEFYRMRAIFELADPYSNADNLAATAVATQYLPCVRMIANLETDYIIGHSQCPSYETFDWEVTYDMVCPETLKRLQCNYWETSVSLYLLCLVVSNK